MFFLKLNKKGFSLIEIVVSVGIFMLLSGFVVLTLIQQQNKASVNALMETVVADISLQRTKAMNGYSLNGQSGNKYGIYFLADKYILFTGDSYSATDTANYTVNLEGGLMFSDINLPNSSIVFNSISGEVSDFSATSNYFTLEDSTQTEAKTARINKYGVIFDLN